MKLARRIYFSLTFIRLMGCVWLINFRVQAKLVWCGTRAGLRGICSTKG